MDEPAKLRDHLLAVKAQGFRAFKIGWGPFGRRNAATDKAIVQAAREAVGADSRLMVDAGGSDAYWPNGYKWALNTARMLADYDVHWFEEALVPDALEDYAKLREHSPVPIAGGEVLTRRQAFQPWLEARAFDIVQPDVTKVGGISEERRIAWMAQEHGVRFIPHGWNTAVGLAADLQLASAFPGHRSRRVSHRLAIHRRNHRRRLAPRRGWHAGDSEQARPRPHARPRCCKEIHGRRVFAGMKMTTSRRRPVPCHSNDL